MKKVVFTCINGHEGYIDLLDNEYMDFWKEVFLKNQKKTSSKIPIIRKKNILSHVLPYGITQMDENVYANEKKAVNTINKNIHELAELGFNFKNKAYIGMPSKQLNKIHREFTTSLITKSTPRVNLTFDDKIEIKLSQYNFNNDDHILRSFNNDYKSIDYKIFKHQICHKLETINACIHRIEENRFSKRALKLKNIYGINAAFGKKEFDRITDKIKTDYNLGRLSNTYGNSSPEYNVYDLKCITGKDYYKAWIDYDDPTEWDVVNNNCTTKGGFDIMPWYSDLHNKYIKPWVASYKMPTDDRYIAPIAIGTVDQHTITKLKDATYKTCLNLRIKAMDLV